MDIAKTFGIDVKDEWKKSGFQLSLTPEEVKNGNRLYVVVKNKDGIEQLKVSVF
ncbi:hypothetical protein K5E_21210 [Enterococcus thailandicus]|uniref:hypothetical protein n=1 Tax=Enterococcus thailandicus TaxID=417368 RepID=UPI00244D9538|nr:hypothetical protein [Enterococcus thailandicus]GMC02818.1 hypothetical protein K4E_03310 [Enterococcus thailandicus]GMC09982.1 hypothetical protein K5E_21210 [Enterococcus thailandicus]